MKTSTCSLSVHAVIAAVLLVRLPISSNQHFSTRSSVRSSCPPFPHLPFPNRHATVWLVRMPHWICSNSSSETIPLE